MQTGSVTPHPTALAGAGRESNYYSEPLTIRRQIGSIVYEVEIHFCPDTRETLNDKILRLMRRDMEAAS
jgi:hypothetical protein